MFLHKGNRLEGNGMTKTNRNFKKVMVCLMAVVFAIGTAAVPAITKKSIVNASSKPVIEEVEYKGNGKVEVDFYGKVQYKNPKVVVKGNGKSYKARITDWYLRASFKIVSKLSVAKF